MSENTQAVESAIDYDLVQFVADIAETTREDVQEMHTRVRALIASGKTPAVAIQIMQDELAAKGLED